MVLLESSDDHPSSFHRPSFSHSDSMASMCGSPEPGEFAVPSSMSDSSEHGGKRDLIPPRKQREFTPDTRKDDTYWDRRRRNNEAAKRSREKRRMNDMVLETRVMELTTENQWLKAELNAIRDKCGIPKDAPPLVNPNSVAQQAPPMSPFGQTATKEVFNPGMQQQQLRPSPNSSNPHSVLSMHHLPAQFQAQAMGGRFLPPMHPALLGAHPAGRMLIPNQHMYLPGGMIPQYGRQMSCQSVSPIPRSSSSGSRESPCGSLGDPRDNGGAVSPSIAAVSSLLKLANSHFNGYPHLPREEDSDVFVGKNDEPEVNNHLPLKLRHKTRIEYEPSPSPPLMKAVPSTSSSSTSSRDEDDLEGSGGYSGEDSAVDVTECDSRKRKAPAAALQTENVQLRGELQRLASEVANLKVMMKNPDSPAPPAKKQRKSRSRR